MGTSALLCFEQKDKSVIATQVLHSGEPDYTGRILLRNYNEPKKAFNLVSFCRVLAGVGGDLNELSWSNVKQPRIRIKGFTDIVGDGKPYTYPTILDLCTDIGMDINYIYLYKNNQWFLVTYKYNDGRPCMLKLKALTYVSTGCIRSLSMDSKYPTGLTTLPVFFVLKEDLEQNGIRCNAAKRVYAETTVIGKRGISRIIKQFEGGLSPAEKRTTGLKKNLPIFLAQRGYSICCANSSPAGVEDISSVCAKNGADIITTNDETVFVVSRNLGKYTEVSLIDASLRSQMLSADGLVQLLCVGDTANGPFEWYWRLNIPEFTRVRGSVFEDWHSVKAMWTKSEMEQFIKTVDTKLERTLEI